MQRSQENNYEIKLLEISTSFSYWLDSFQSISAYIFDDKWGIPLINTEYLECQVNFLTCITMFK